MVPLFFCFNLFECTAVISAPRMIQNLKTEATCHACHPIAVRAQHWAEVGLYWRSMVDTSVLDASDHGPALFHSITTERLLTCEAPRVKKRITAGSSETSFAPILQQDKIRGPLYCWQVYWKWLWICTKESIKPNPSHIGTKCEVIWLEERNVK